MPRIIICKGCKMEKEHSGKGMCHSCYCLDKFHNDPKYRKTQLASAKRWAKNNPEKVLEKNRRYEQTEKRKKKKKEQNARPDVKKQKLEYSRSKGGKKKHKEYLKKWYPSENGKLSTLVRHLRRATVKKLVIHLFTKQEITQKKKECNGRCQNPKCKKPIVDYKGLTLGHIYSLDKAYWQYLRKLYKGDYESFPTIYGVDNIQFLCGPCNYSKCNKDEGEWLKGART